MTLLMLIVTCTSLGTFVVSGDRHVKEQHMPSLDYKPTPFNSKRVRPSRSTTALIDQASKMQGTQQQKAAFLARSLAASFIEYGPYHGLSSPGYDEEEGLPEPTPMCKRIMNKWTRKCLFKQQREFPSPGISPGLDEGASPPFDGTNGGGNVEGGGPGGDGGGGGGGGGSKCNGLIGAIVCFVKKVAKHVGKALGFGFRQINGTKVLIPYYGSNFSNATNAWLYQSSLLSSNRSRSPVTPGVDVANNSFSSVPAPPAGRKEFVINDDELLHAAMISHD